MRKGEERAQDCYKEGVGILGGGGRGCCHKKGGEHKGVRLGMNGALLSCSE